MARAWRKKGQVNRWLNALEQLRRSIGERRPKHLTARQVRAVEGEIAILERKLRESGVQVPKAVVIK